MCPNDILINVVVISLMVWELLRKSRYFRVTPRIYIYVQGRGYGDGRTLF